MNNNYVLKKTKSFSRLDSFVKQNETVDFQLINLSRIGENTDVNWNRLKTHKEEIKEQIVLYRRLLRIMPQGTDHEIIMKLLAAEIFFRPANRIHAQA